MYIIVVIYNVMYFNVKLNNFNVRQRQNNVVIFNVDFHNVGQRRNNVANMTIWKKIKCRFKNKIIFLIFKEYAGPKIFKSILRGICKRIFTEPHKFLKHRITKNIFKLFHFVKCHLVFKFNGKIQAHYDYRSFNFICIF